VPCAFIPCRRAYIQKHKETETRLEDLQIGFLVIEKNISETCP